MVACARMIRNLNLSYVYIRNSITISYFISFEALRIQSSILPVRTASKMLFYPEASHIAKISKKKNNANDKRQNKKVDYFSRVFYFDKELIRLF